MPTDEEGEGGGSSYDSVAEGPGEAPVCRVDSFVDWMRIAALVCTLAGFDSSYLHDRVEADLDFVAQQLDLCSPLVFVQQPAQTAVLHQKLMDMVSQCLVRVSADLIQGYVHM